MPSPCAGCQSRRAFLANASALTVGALVAAACGDGTIDGPAEILELASSPVPVDPRAIAALGEVGGRTIITPAGRAPIVLERVAADDYRALSLVCPHRGAIVDLQTDGYRCANHGARFATDGAWVGGQEAASLTRIAVVHRGDGTLLVGGVAPPLAAPSIRVSAPAIGFVANVTGGAPAPQTLAITNGGDGFLRGVAVALAYGNSEPRGWLNIATSGATNPGPNSPQTLTLTVDRGTLPAGTYGARLTITSTDTGAPVDVPVALVVQDPDAPSAILLSSFAVNLSALVAAVAPVQTIQVLHQGGNPVAGLAVSIVYGTGARGWLTATLSRTGTPATLELRADASALPAGRYTATVQVSGNGVVSRSLPVNFDVSAAGLAVRLADFPALATVGGAAGSVGLLNGGPVAVSRVGTSTFLAFSMRCPHAGSLIRVENHEKSGSVFHCPNHGQLWDLRGELLDSSPFRYSELQPLTTRYTPGDTILHVS